MKEALKFIPFLAIIFLLTTSIGNINNAQTLSSAPINSKEQDSNGINTVTIPTGTIIKVKLQNSLNSKINQVGDEVTGIIESSVTIDNLVAIKKGTEVQGRITQVSEAKRPQKQASMTIVFDKLITSTSTQKIETTVKAIDDYANDQRKSADDEGKVQGGHSGRRTVDNAVKGGGLGTIVGIPIILLGGRTAGATVPLGGVTAGVLLSKGNDIKLAPGTIFRVEITKPIIITNKIDNKSPTQQSTE